VQYFVLLFDKIILKNTAHKISTFFTLLVLNFLMLVFKGISDIFKEIEWVILFFILFGSAFFYLCY
jgi:hypothetical protein